MTLTDEQLAEIRARLGLFEEASAKEIMGKPHPISMTIFFRAAPTDIRALLDEITALRHDVTRHMEIANERLAEIEKLRSGMIRAGLHKEAPCRICGYNGPGFYQPDTHSCVALAASHD